MKFQSAIERFLLRFDYTTKVLFIIIFCITGALYILYLLTQSTNSLINRLDQQISGLENQRLLNFLVEKTAIYEQLVSASPIDEKHLGIENDIEDILNLLKKKVHSGWFSFSSHTKSLKQMEDTADNLLMTWKNFRKEFNQIVPVNREISYVEFLTLIEKAIQQNNDLFHLSLSFDGGDSLLLQIITQQLPQVQRLIAKLQLLTDLFAQDSESQSLKMESVLALNNLETLNESIVSHLNSALMINSSIEKIANDNHLEIAFNSYQEEFFKLHQALDQLWSSGEGHRKISSEDMSLFQTSFMATAAFVNHSIDVIIPVLKLQRASISSHRLIGSLCIVIGVGVIILLYRTRVIRLPLHELKTNAERLTKGNLSVRSTIISKDEVGAMSEAFNHTVEFFEKIMLDAGGITLHLVNSASQVFANAHSLEASLVQQESAINQIANNAKGISRTVQDFALSLKEVNNAATLTGRLADLGRTSLVELEMIMQQMATASNNIVKTLSGLHDNVGTINLLINTIIRIADQINLLSLNTAIRAGKKGSKYPGFSVIADKIRELADQTAIATLDIESVVKSIFTSVQETAAEADQFYAQIQKEIDEATEIRQYMKKLILHTQSQRQSFEIVNNGMKEQTVRAAHIQNSIASLTTGARQTTESIRTLYLEIEYLYHSTHNLQEMILHYTNQSLQSQPQQPSSAEVIKTRLAP